MVLASYTLEGVLQSTSGALRGSNGSWSFIEIGSFGLFKVRREPQPQRRVEIARILVFWGELSNLYLFDSNAEATRHLFWPWAQFSPLRIEVFICDQAKTKSTEKNTMAIGCALCGSICAILMHHGN